MTFAVPLFLLAALAGVIPVVIHLIHRQKATVIRFSTLRFLRISVQRTRRRKYIGGHVAASRQGGRHALDRHRTGAPRAFQPGVALGRGGNLPVIQSGCRAVLAKRMSQS